jgi:ABC-2 type transport system permease protein
LISLDLRFNALPLYFSRPLRRFDYFVGKLGVIFWFLAAVVILPSLIAYALGMACSLDISILRDTFMILVNSIFFGLVVTVSAGLFILALSSLTRNSRYVALLWVGIWIISSVTSGILDSAQEQQKGYARRREFRMEIERRRASRGMAPAPVYAIPDDAGQSPATTALEDAKTDWRPLVSYFANLSRVENHLLGVNETWERIAQLVPDEQRDYFLILQEGDRYPVSWSAGVIVGLCGLSILILNFRVKSLDRLK